MSYLQDLYYGSLCPQADNQGFAQTQECFRKMLSAQAPELEQTFNILMSDMLHIYSVDTKNMFFQGFGLAVKLLTEALAH